MKNKLLSLFFVLGSYSIYSQVVIGKKEMTPSAQLEVFAEDQGMLIPRVELKEGVYSTYPIVLGKEQTEIPPSLLVFNIYTGLDVKPGLYYWYDNKWNRMMTEDDISKGKNKVSF